jgi:hypothetical protein
MTFPSSGCVSLVQMITGTTVALAAANFINAPTVGGTGTPQLNSGNNAYPLAYGNASAVLATSVNPSSNALLCVNTTPPASISIAATGYGGEQGNDSNPSGSIGSVIPQVMIQLQNLVLAMSAYTYRM